MAQILPNSTNQHHYRHQSPWSSPMDPRHLKRRHTRGNTARSSSSSSHLNLLDSRSSSSSLSALSSNDDYHFFNSNSNAASFDTNNGGHRKQQQQQQQQHSRIKSSKSAHFQYDDPFCTPYSDGVPSWFGSLRSFAISASTSSRGAFAPLVASTSSSSSQSSSSSHTTPSRGKSSSIYYAGSSSIIDPYDSEDSDLLLQEDEPITDRNGLKENRVRGPRKSWSVLDPSLGGLFSSQSYTAVPTSSATSSEPELTSSSSCSSRCPSLHSSSTDSHIESLGIPDIGDERHIGCYRDDEDDSTNAKDNFDRCYAPASLSSSSSSSFSTEPSLSPTTPTTTTSSSSSSSAFSILKSYVPNSILPGFSGKGPIALPDNVSHISSQKPSPPSSSSVMPPSSLASSEAVAPSTTGFWSLRKLTMNFMSNNQYEQVGNNNNNKGDNEDDDDDDPGNYSKGRIQTEGEINSAEPTSCRSRTWLPVVEKGQRYRDDPESEEDAENLSKIQGGSTSTVGYRSSMLGSASSTVMSKGLQQLPPVSNGVRDRLERLPGSGGLHSVKKIGRQD
ncbi:hypothetical protein BG004_007099 [Podila humilis]|nr:hypothetical protein BG004_007099 [Podila humilis]